MKKILIVLMTALFLVSCNKQTEDIAAIQGEGIDTGVSDRFIAEILAQSEKDKSE